MEKFLCGFDGFSKTLELVPRFGGPKLLPALGPKPLELGPKLLVPKPKPLVLGPKLLEPIPKLPMPRPKLLEP